MFYMGLDLGKRQDPSTIAVVEDEWRGDGLMVRHLERAPLGTKYPAVVARVREVAQDEELRGQCSLAVDGTGVGAPVVDMLWEAQTGCPITEVTITSGDKETQRAGGGYGREAWGVPKRDLMAGVQVALERGQLKIARGLREAGVLVEELVGLRMTFRGSGRIRLGADGFGEHDDLAIALALAVWLARRPKPRMNSWCGGGRLPGR